MLLDEARRQVSERGYAGTTVRSVAAACGLACGTVYNYFESKDMLIASFVADDWIKCTAALRLSPAADAKELMRQIYDMLVAFSLSHQTLFTDPDAAKTFNSIFSQRHSQLRRQIAEMIIPALPEGDDRDFVADFIAEAILTWTTAGRSFDEIFRIIEKIIK